MWVLRGIGEHKKFFTRCKKSMCMWLKVRKTIPSTLIQHVVAIRVNNEQGCLICYSSNKEKKIEKEIHQIGKME